MEKRVVARIGLFATIKITETLFEATNNNLCTKPTTPCYVCKTRHRVSRRREEE